MNGELRQIGGGAVKDRARDEATLAALLDDAPTTAPSQLRTDHGWSRTGMGLFLLIPLTAVLIAGFWLSRVWAPW